MLPERMLAHSWIAPAIAGVLSVLLLGTLLWFMRRHDLMDHADEFASDVDSALQSVRLHLQSDEKFLRPFGWRKINYTYTDREFTGTPLCVVKKPLYELLPLAMALGIVLLCVFPEIATWLPDAVMGPGI